MFRMLLNNLVIVIVLMAFIAIMITVINGIFFLSAIIGGHNIVLGNVTAITLPLVLIASIVTFINWVRKSVAQPPHHS